MLENHGAYILFREAKIETGWMVKLNTVAESHTHTNPCLSVVSDWRLNIFPVHSLLHTHARTHGGF